jgi:hypothetical protein
MAAGYRAVFTFMSFSILSPEDQWLGASRLSLISLRISRNKVITQLGEVDETATRWVFKLK